MARGHKDTGITPTALPLKAAIPTSTPHSTLNTPHYKKPIFYILFSKHFLFQKVAFQKAKVYNTV
jgi:hypothetical protein